MKKEWLYGFFRSDQGRPLKMSPGRNGGAFQESKGWHRRQDKGRWGQAKSWTNWKPPEISPSSPLLIKFSLLIKGICYCHEHILELDGVNIINVI